jgi:hypothetical protein
MKCRSIGQYGKSINRKFKTLEDLFWKYVKKGKSKNSCWNWTGCIKPDGYGLITWRKIKNKPINSLAHRVSYKLHNGDIPNNLPLDHLCRNTICVNPDHLEAVTLSENWRRGFSISAINKRKDKCLKGHKFTKDNTYIIKNKNRKELARNCKRCNADRKLKEYHNKKRDCVTPD